MYLRNEGLWPGLSLTFDGVEGSLGARGVGKLGSGAGWGVDNPLTLDKLPSPLGSQHPRLKCEGFGRDDLGGPFSNILRRCACYLSWFPVCEQQCSCEDF